MSLSGAPFVMAANAADTDPVDSCTSPRISAATFSSGVARKTGSIS